MTPSAFLSKTPRTTPFSRSIRVDAWSVGTSGPSGSRVIGKTRFSANPSRAFIPRMIFSWRRPELALKIGRRPTVATKNRPGASAKMARVFFANVLITAMRRANGNLTGFSLITRDFSQPTSDSPKSREGFSNRFPTRLSVIDRHGKNYPDECSVRSYFRLQPQRAAGQTCGVLNARSDLENGTSNTSPATSPTRACDLWESVWNCSVSAKIRATSL